MISILCANPDSIYKSMRNFAKGDQRTFATWMIKMRQKWGLLRPPITCSVQCAKLIPSPEKLNAS